LNTVPTTSPFLYELPSERIAQRPLRPYHNAKLLVVDRSKAELKESLFIDLADFLNPGDLLVLNDTRVMQARLFGLSSGREVEVLLVSQFSTTQWSCLARPARKLKAGTEIEFESGLTATVLGRGDDGSLNLEFNRDLEDSIEQCGVMPIPPYIRKGRGDHQDKLDCQFPGCCSL